MTDFVSVRMGADIQERVYLCYMKTGTPWLMGNAIGVDFRAYRVSATWNR